MLVLSRGIGETIRIGDGVVEICDIKGKRVQFGFRFPENIGIYRSELPAEKRETLIDQRGAKHVDGLDIENGQLVLSRTLDKSFEIDGFIRLTLKKIRGSKVSIGIDAPRSVQIVRGELQPHRAA